MSKLTPSQVKTILSWMNINQPRNEAEGKFRTREFLKLAKGYGVRKKTFKSGKFKGSHLFKLGSNEYLVSPNKRHWVLN